MSYSTPKGVPKPIYVIIIVLLAAMYYYAAFVDISNPEKVVEDFYHAYFQRDFDTVASHLSVFWSVQFLPQYMSSSPAQLLEQRDQVENDIAKVITDIEKSNELPQNLAIKILPDYTRQKPNSALVAYSFEEDGKSLGMEMTILIKEKGEYRIYSMSPINAEIIKSIPDSDLEAMDQSFKNLVETK